MPKLNMFGVKQQFGCPGCDGSVTGNWSKVKNHMHYCCPRFFDEHPNGDLRNRLCALGMPKCIVPGHSFEVWEARRLEKKADKKRVAEEKKHAAEEKEKAIEAEGGKVNLTWDVHDDKLDGSCVSYEVRDKHTEDVDPMFRKALEDHFDKDPDGPYSVQAAMGTWQDWIHWGCLLVNHWTRTNQVSVVIHPNFKPTTKNKHISTMTNLPSLLLLLLPALTFSIDYGTDVSYPMHYPQVTSTLLGTNKQQLYEDHLKGCSDYYDRQKPNTGRQRCMEVEKDRIGMNLRQPQSMVNYTKNGYVKIRAPDAVWKLVQEFWALNKDKGVEEDWPAGSIYVNHWSSKVEMVAVDNHTLVGGGNILKNAIWNAARDTIKEWTGHTLADCSLYGIRIYHEGSILAPHVDRLPLVASAILNVDQDVDEPWPLEVIGHDQKATNITMLPGDLVLYESHSVIHGRPFPLKGRFLANIFIHFEPVAPLDDPNPIFQADLPPYVLPNSPEIPHWQSQNPQGWQAVQTKALTGGTTEAHQIVIQQNIDDLKYILNLHPSYANAADELGWTPLHEATRTHRVDLVQVLVEQGSNVHAKTKSGESVLFLAVYFVELEAPEEYYRQHPYQHPMVQYLQGLGAKVERDGYNMESGGGENGEPEL